MSGSLIWSLVLAAVAFGNIYYPALDKLARGLASPYAKADGQAPARGGRLLIVTGRSHDSALYPGAVLVSALIFRGGSETLFRLAIPEIEDDWFRDLEISCSCSPAPICGLVPGSAASNA
jgi:hypothetical protein